MLTFFIYLVGTLLVLVCLLIVLLVLMQRPKQEGLGAAFGAGVTDQIWGSQTTNVLQKGTVILGVLFFVFSITLTVLEASKSRELTGMKVPTTTVVAPDPAASLPPLGSPGSPIVINSALAPEVPAVDGIPAALPVETTPPATPAEAAPAVPAESDPAAPAVAAPTETITPVESSTPLPVDAPPAPAEINPDAPVPVEPAATPAETPPPAKPAE